MQFGLKTLCYNAEAKYIKIEKEDCEKAFTEMNEKMEN
jgi:hypothetical protein